MCVVRGALHHDIWMKVGQGILGVTGINGSKVVRYFLVYDNEDLYTLFCFLLQKSVESPAPVFGRRATEIKLWTEPPVVYVDPLFRK